MSVLGDLRQEVVEALTGLDLTLYTHIPGRMNLPGAFVMAGSPYVEQGQTFGERLVRFSVVTATNTGENNAETAALDELLEAAQARLEAAGWTVESISQPEAQAFGNAEALVASLNVAALVTFPNHN